MTPYVTITLEGTPIGKERPRLAGGGHVYTPAKTKAFEEALRWEATLAMRGKEIIETPVRIVVSAFFAIPKSWPGWKWRAARQALIWPTSKPDVDNILKTIDGLNAICWCDDRQVIDASVRKFYAEVPRLTIAVYALEEYTRDVD